MLLVMVRTGCVRGQAPRTFSATHPREGKSYATRDRTREPDAGNAMLADAATWGKRAVVMSHHDRGRAAG